MSRLRSFSTRVLATLAGRRQPRRLDEELGFHLDRLAEDYMRQGLSPEDATRDARKALGGVARTQDAYDDQRTLPVLDALLQDVRYALRLVRRHPGFSLVAVLTLALGIGANTAIFSVIQAVFLRPLPYPAPHELVQFNREIRGSLQGAAQYGTSYRFLRDHLRAYEGVASFMGRGAMPLVEDRQSEQIRALAVSPAYFDVLGIQPARGRAFTADEATANGPDAVILSHGLWQRTFHGDPGVLQRTVLLGGTPHPVVGIMPEGFVTRPLRDAWIPLRPGGHEAGYNIGVVARLRDGVTMAQAQSELDTAMPQWFAATGAPFRAHVKLRLRPFQSDAADGLTRPLIVLMITVALVLLIACANLANLLLARATTRLREIAVRATLGASRARLIRQLIVESIVLAAFGGVVGLLLAYWTMPALLAISPVDQAYWGTIGLDRRVLAFAGALSIATGVLFGLVPALQATRVDLSESTKEGGRSSSGRRIGLLRRVLIVGEVAVSVTLLIGALLLVRTFVNLTAVDPGFDPRRVTVASMGMTNARYATAATVSQFYRDGLAAVLQIPGVESAAVVSNAPLDGNGLNVPFISRAPHADGQVLETDKRYITSDYFRVMRAPLVQGRLLTDADSATSPRVAVVNQQFVRTFLRDLDPIGQRMQMSVPAGKDDDESVVEIVGVVGDMKQRSLAAPAPETMYVPVTQMSDAGLRQVHTWFETYWVVRSHDEGTGLAEALPRALRAVDPVQPFSRIRPMTSLIDLSLTAQRFHMLLIGACALLAVVLAAAGLFGVISFAVAQRGHEMGVRLALGATAGQLVGSVVREGAVLAAVGVGLGLGGAMALTRLLKTFMFGVSPTDPVTFVFAAVLLMGLAISASLVPALRLTRLDPASVLRQG